MHLIRRDPDLGYVSNWLWVPKKNLNVAGTKNVLAIPFYDTNAPNNIGYVHLWRETQDHLLVPRAFWDVRSMGHPVIDLRPTHYPRTGITSRIKLDHREQEVSGKKVLLPTGDDVQQRALDAMLSMPGGILQLGCGKGKTCIALELITRLGVPGLVVLPDTQLLEQWANEIEKLLDVPGGVGLIQASKNDWKKFLVLTTYHTIGSRASAGLPEELLRWFGVVVWDEGHHIPAPTFAASAEAFYGRRYALTATPKRDDGMHVISEMHVGPILYRDLTQDLKPSIYFRWTGLELDEERPDCDVRDVTGEIHLGLVAGYFGKWEERRRMLLDDVAEAVKHGRRVLVLSTSEGEIVNLAALWTYGTWNRPNPGVPLFTDIPVPIPADVGETLAPIAMPVAERRKLEANLEQLRAQLQTPLTQRKRETVENMVNETELVLKQVAVNNKLEAELTKRQKKYINALIPHLTTCGFMVHKVPAKTRHKFAETMPVIFAITKYGKEGLDSPALDTIFVSTPFSSRNGLQQVMGRPSRVHAGKKTPVVIFYEDKIGPLIGMCKKLKKHLRDWPHEEGGPFDYELIGHPQSRKQWSQNPMTSILGQ